MVSYVHGSQENCYALNERRIHFERSTRAQSARIHSNTLDVEEFRNLWIYQGFFEYPNAVTS